MAQHMAPLPGKPDFPVFGLGQHFDGYRWLVLWNDRDQLYSVTLGHGHPESGSWITVTTVHKTAKRRVGPNMSVGPTGYGDAVMDAVTSVAELVHPDDRAARNALIRREGAAATPDANDSSLSSNWIPDELSVGARLHSCWSYELDGARAKLIDLSDVAIAVTGPLGSDPMALVNVVDELDVYV